MDLGATNIRFIDVGRYRHNSNGFFEKFSCLISMNTERIICTQGANIKFPSLSLMVKSVRQEI